VAIPYQSKLCSGHAQPLTAISNEQKPVISATLSQQLVLAGNIADNTLKVKLFRVEFF
jgi:hypothetical protein